MAAPPSSDLSRSTDNLKEGNPLQAGQVNSLNGVYLTQVTHKDNTCCRLLGVTNVTLRVTIVQADTKARYVRNGTEESVTPPRETGQAERACRRDTLWIPFRARVRWNQPAEENTR